jgi:carbamoyl-phosphate synthase large subunit
MREICWEIELNNILVTSSGDKIPLILALKESISRNNLPLRVIAGDISKEAVSFYFTPTHWVMPPAIDSSIDEIVRGCVEREIVLIFPTRDGDLDFYSRYEEKFSEVGVTVMCSEKKAVNNCLDKVHFYEKLKKEDLPVIKTSNFYMEEFKQSVTVKERYGAGSKNVRMNLTRKESEFYANQLTNPIFQPTIFGNEFSIDVWSSKDQGSIICSPRFRKIVKGGESVVTTLFVDNQLNLIAKKIVKSLGLQGICVIQGITDEKGEYNIIECNARIGGASTATINAGGLLIDLSLLDFLNMDYLKIFKSITLKMVTQVRVKSDHCF